MPVNAGRVIISLSGTTLLEEERELIRHSMTAGIILFKANFADKKTLEKLIAEIQKEALCRGCKEDGLPIFVDHEGGRVQRFITDGFTVLPAVAEIGATYDCDNAEGLEQAKAHGELMASELKDLGIISLAPVLDLNAGNEVISGLGRAFHAEPQVCASLAGKYIQGMLDAGMEATGKHFPGHGQNIGDSHQAVLTDNRTLAEIEANDLIPFRQLIADGLLAAIMPAHIFFTRIDPDNTVVTSKIWLEDILRKKYGFQGLIVSDCLSMKGAGDYTALDKTKHALKYCDVVLLCHLKPEEYLSILNALAADVTFAASVETKARMLVWTANSLPARLKLHKHYSRNPESVDGETDNDTVHEISFVGDGINLDLSRKELYHIAKLVVDDYKDLHLIEQYAHKNLGRLIVEVLVSGDVDTLKILLRAGLEPNTKVHGASLLALAAGGLRPGAIKLLLEHGADINLPNGLNDSVIWGETPIQEGNYYDSSTPIFSACFPSACYDGSALARDDIRADHLATIRLLISKGARLHYRGEGGRTVLSEAISLPYNMYAVVTELLKHGSSPSAKEEVFGYDYMENDISSITDGVAEKDTSDEQQRINAQNESNESKESDILEAYGEAARRIEEMDIRAAEERKQLMTPLQILRNPNKYYSPILYRLKNSEEFKQPGSAAKADLDATEKLLAAVTVQKVYRGFRARQKLKL